MTTIRSRRQGVVVVDHGSRQPASNAMLLEVVRLFREQSPYDVVEAAHMELAEPSLSTAFDRCVSAGARRVIVSPYFLAPGRHWQEDIPRLAAEAAARHAGVEYLVAAPLGLHPLLTQLMELRIEHCLAHARGEREPCDVCRDVAGCQMRLSGRTRKPG